MAASKALDRYTGGKYKSLQAKSKNYFPIFFNMTALKIFFLLAQYMHHISGTKCKGIGYCSYQQEITYCILIINDVAVPSLH